MKPIVLPKTRGFWHSTGKREEDRAYIRAGSFLPAPDSDSSGSDTDNVPSSYNPSFNSTQVLLIPTLFFR